MNDLKSSYRVMTVWHSFIKKDQRVMTVLNIYYFVGCFLKFLANES